MRKFPGAVGQERASNVCTYPNQRVAAEKLGILNNHLTTEGVTRSLFRVVTGCLNKDYLSSFPHAREFVPLELSHVVITAANDMLDSNIFY